MDQGWIKLHREILEKPIWTASTPEQKVLLLTLMMMANHSEKQWEWKGKIFTARPGEVVTSLPILAKKCGKNSSIQKVRTGLKRFEKYGFLTDESTPHNRMITIVNWEVYQGGGENTADLATDGEQASSRQVTSNKNDKNDKNEKISNRRKPVYDESSLFYQLALAHSDEIDMNHPGGKEPNLQKWANDFRLIVERDGQTFEEITQLMKWSAQHTFWHTVILSPSSLRRNWDQMASQFKQERTDARSQIVAERTVEEFKLDLTKGEDL